MQKSKVKKSHLRLKRQKNFRGNFFLILLVLIFLAIIYIWQRVTVITLAGEIKKMYGQIDNHRREYKYLQVEVASLGSVERIEKLAKEMGFVYPSVEQIEILPEVPDSTGLGRQSWIDKIWLKLK